MPCTTYSYDGPEMKAAATNSPRRRTSSAKWAAQSACSASTIRTSSPSRERLELLFDEGSFLETGLLAHHQSQSPAMQGKFTPADGVVTGVGEVDGRKVAVIAYDFTVMAGSMGMVTELKATRMREARPARAHPARVAHRFGRCPDPGGDRARCSPGPAISSESRW